MGFHFPPATIPDTTRYNVLVSASRKSDDDQRLIGILCLINSSGF